MAYHPSYDIRSGLIENNLDNNDFKASLLLHFMSVARRAYNTQTCLRIQVRAKFSTSDCGLIKRKPSY
jgi:hypothetical protein